MTPDDLREAAKIIKTYMRAVEDTLFRKLGVQRSFEEIDTARHMAALLEDEAERREMK